ncbi:MAG: hypothetical protein QXG17_01610 [Sulfolobales archaeon]
MSSEEEKKKRVEGLSDVEELREVLRAISEFLAEIREPLENLIKTVTDAGSGEKLAKEVATFYKSLIESGIDQQTAKEWAEKFFVQRLESIPSLAFLKEIFREWGSRESSKAEQVAEEESRQESE